MEKKNGSNTKTRSEIWNKIKAIVLSWDFGLAFLISLISFFIFPLATTALIAKDIFSVGISVLAIIFSVFFAALAVLVTAGDNEFVEFLQVDGLYTRIVWLFRWTLSVIFFALLSSIILFITTVIEVGKPLAGYYPRGIMVGYSFVFSYALFAAVCSSGDAIRYAERRASFLHVLNGKKNNSPIRNVTESDQGSKTKKTRSRKPS